MFRFDGTFQFQEFTYIKEIKSHGTCCWKLCFESGNCEKILPGTERRFDIPIGSGMVHPCNLDP